MKRSVAIAVMMLMTVVPGFCGNSTGQGPHGGAVATKSASVGRTAMVELAAADLMRQVVDGSPQGNKVAR